MDGNMDIGKLVCKERVIVTPEEAYLVTCLQTPEGYRRNGGGIYVSESNIIIPTSEEVENYG